MHWAGVKANKPEGERKPEFGHSFEWHAARFPVSTNVRKDTRSGTESQGVELVPLVRRSSFAQNCSRSRGSTTLSGQTMRQRMYHHVEYLGDISRWQFPCLDFKLEQPKLQLGRMAGSLTATRIRPSLNHIKSEGLQSR